MSSSNSNMNTHNKSVSVILALRGRHLQVTNDYAVNKLSELAILRDIIEVRESPLIIISHMHPAVEHDVFFSNGQQNAASSNIYISCHILFQQLRGMDSSAT
jgi:hypothetical protein